MKLEIDLTDAGRRAAAIETKLRPLTSRPTDLMKRTRLKEASPLDEAGLRAESEALMEFLLTAYEHGDVIEREAIRAIMANNPSFGWATGVALAPDTKEGFRRHLLRLSAIDCAQDLRDVWVSVRELARSAQHAGIETRPILEEVAAISSNQKQGAVGSIRSILRRFC